MDHDDVKGKQPMLLDEMNVDGEVPEIQVCEVIEQSNACVRSYHSVATSRSVHAAYHPQTVTDCSFGDLVIGLKVN